MADNQFYRDNSPNIEEFKFIDSMLGGLSNALDDILSQAVDNSKISSIRAFTNIPIQIINVADACYTLSNLLSNKDVLGIVGINPNLSLQEKIEIWESSPLKVRAQALEQSGLVLMLVNPNLLKTDDIYGDTFKVVDFEMYDYNTGDKLIFGLDYYYEYNKIYFLKFGAQTSRYNNKSIILKNIVIDNNNPEKILGESLNIYASSNFSPSEYRDVITSFASAALAGPVINKINQSFNPDNALSSIDRAYGINDDENSLKGVYVVDYKSANDIMKKFWDNTGEESTHLTKFDFLVTIPSEYLNKTEKVEYIQKFMNMIKPVHAAFILCPEYTIKDSLAMRYLPDQFNTSGTMKDILEKVNYTESEKQCVRLPMIEKIYAKRYPHDVADLPETDADYYIDTLLVSDNSNLNTFIAFRDTCKKPYTYFYNAKATLTQKDIIRKEEKMSKYGEVLFKTIYKCKVDSFKYKSMFNSKDKIICKSSESSYSLNKSGLCDNITIRNELYNKTPISKKIDNLNFVTKANQVKCDSIFNFDLDQENPLRLDVEYTDTDLEAIGRELVSIKLIPKS